jgi:glycosyltransferase involved in cell wall biosynthesis
MVGIAGCEALASARADVAVGVSQDTVRIYPWLDGVVPCGVDVERFEAAGPRETHPTILFVGTFERRKRGRLLWEAFQEVIRPALPTARLWMVCSDAPAAPGVEVFGRVSDRRLSELYSRAWVFCLPSAYEGFGVPYLEAMAAGCPVVATPNPGAREVLAEGELGELVQVEQLGSALLALLQDPARREVMARRGEEASMRYGWSDIAARYEELYELALIRAGRRRRHPVPRQARDER